MYTDVVSLIDSLNPLFTKELPVDVRMTMEDVLICAYWTRPRM